MPVFCAAYGCNNRRSIESRSRGITFHKFPRATDLKKQWEVATRREGFVATESSKLCSEHFKPADFDRTGQIVRLRDGATPSVFKSPPPRQRPVAKRNKKTSREAEEILPVDLSQCSPERKRQPNTDHSYALHSSPTCVKASVCEASGGAKGLKREKLNPKVRERRAEKNVNSLLEDRKRKDHMNKKLKKRLDFHSAVGPKDPMAIERCNLLSMLKLSIKVLIQTSLSLGRTLDSEHPPLQQFFIVLEHCLKHGLKAKKSFIGQNKSIWGPLELVEKLCPESANIATSARDLPSIKTGLGRARAWLHLVLMQKKVADYMKALLDRKDLLSEFYDSGALMTEEEGAVMGGLLVGLNVIDANLCIKGEDLDSQVGVIDFSLYLKDPTASETPKDDNKMTAILDQKHYIEELNRHLSGTVTDLQAKMDSIEKTNSKLVEELTAATDRINSLQEEQEQLRKENETILHSSQKKEEAALRDSQVELETYKQTRQGLDEMYNVVWTQYKEEKRIRQDLERELELQVGLKVEMEVAMKLLEKDIHEKQDTLAALRLQLDQVKTLNLQMFHKAQDSERQAEKKQAEAVQVEKRINEMEKAMMEMEQRLQNSEQERKQTDQSDKDMKVELEGKIDSLQKQLTDLDTLRLGLESELRSEREQRQNLQKVLQREQDNSTELRTQLQQLQGLQTELQELKQEKKQLQQKCEQQEQTLQEMGLHLSQSKLKMEDFKEVNKALKGHAWLKDDEATQCKQCQKEFSISRRKHHCRNCGDIYCNSCSSNELALPSYPRRVRVCDVCHSLLLKRSSSTAS